MNVRAMLDNVRSPNLEIFATLSHRFKTATPPMTWVMACESLIKVYALLDHDQSVFNQQLAIWAADPHQPSLIEDEIAHWSSKPYVHLFSVYVRGLEYLIDCERASRSGPSTTLHFVEECTRKTWISAELASWQITPTQQTEVCRRYPFHGFLYKQRFEADEGWWCVEGKCTC